MAGKDKVVKSSKKGTGRKRVEKPFKEVLCMNLMGENRGNLIDYCIDNGMKTVPAEKFVADVVNLTLAGIGRPKRKGGLIEKYLNWSLYGIGKEPMGDKTTLNTLKKFATAWKEVV